MNMFSLKHLPRRFNKLPVFLFLLFSINSTCWATTYVDVKAVTSEKVNGTLPALDPLVFYLWPNWEFLQGTSPDKTTGSSNNATNKHGGWMAFLVEVTSPYTGYDSLTPGQQVSANYIDVNNPSVSAPTFYYGRMMFTTLLAPTGKDTRYLTGSTSSANSYLLEFYSPGITSSKTKFSATVTPISGSSLTAYLTVYPKL